MFMQGQPEYTSHTKKENGNKEFLLGATFAGLKFKGALLTQKQKELIAKELEAEKTDMRLKEMAKEVAMQMQQVDETVNNLPMLPINQDMSGFPPPGAMPPLQQPNTAPPY
jgi:hypothetical protein